jgi:hypothetical protein
VQEKPVQENLQTEKTIQTKRGKPVAGIKEVKQSCKRNLVSKRKLTES